MVLEARRSVRPLGSSGPPRYPEESPRVLGIRHPMSPPVPHPCSDRGMERPVRRRTRTFRPNYLSFAGTYQCNLRCPHCCVPIEWTDRLSIPAAVRFLEDAHAYGIGILGFTGGEPFLYAEFVHILWRRAAELGFRFDKIVTNGVSL